MGVIDNIIQDKQDIKNQLGSTPSVFPTVKKFNNFFEVKRHSVKLVETNIAGAMIWGHPTFGIWGESNWGDPAGGSFILSSSGFGILGVNKLGAGGSFSSTYAVLPDNNIFYERFLNTTYIDTIASNGVQSTTAETYTLDSTEILQSNVIAKLREPIIKATFYSNASLIDTGTGMILPFTLGTSTFSADNAQLMMSNDSGVTWHSVNEGEEFIFPVSSTADELKYKIISSSSITISDPITIKIN